jgi:hypothetical protein
VASLAIEAAAPHRSFHAFIVQTAVAPGEMIGDGPGIVDFEGKMVLLPGLGLGRHRLTIALGDGKGSRVGMASDQIELDNLGPTGKATAPAEASVATGFKIDAVLEGVGMLAPGRDKGGAGRTGHLHLLINPPTLPPPTASPSLTTQQLPFGRDQLHRARPCGRRAHGLGGRRRQKSCAVELPVADKVTVALR